MTKPESKRILSQRKVMVEPVFSALRGIQGVERFRRRGLSAVRVEFTLHAIAYNLSRAVALILWVIFSLSWIVSPNNRQSISVGLLSMPAFCDTLCTGGEPIPSRLQNPGCVRIVSHHPAVRKAHSP
ncbi:transposase [Photorhabdus sp. RM96S]|uniref:transposase n=1 Tax=Photorhabdus sp. RM96S TaxID=3342822 RepID=UPI0036DB4A2E